MCDGTINAVSHVGVILADVTLGWSYTVNGHVVGVVVLVPVDGVAQLSFRTSVVEIIEHRQVAQNVHVHDGFAFG